MCGRFTQHYSWAGVHEFLSTFGPPQNLRPRYNIAPTTTIDVVKLNAEGQRELVQMRWGLVPFFWKKALKDVPATFNARFETVHEKPTFRDAFKKRRCIIPASGFFEWTDEPDGKQPHLFTAADGFPVLAFAGLWDQWKNPATGELMLSCTMIVSDASDWMGPMIRPSFNRRPHRMRLSMAIGGRRAFVRPPRAGHRGAIAVRLCR